MAAALVLAGAAPLRASDVTRAYLTDVWTADEGLPDSSVTAVAQTPDGYLWIGTYNGLVRFDGDRFATFDPANTPALARARVRQLAVDALGTLWINTFDGSLTSLRHGVFAREWTGTDEPDPDVTLLTSSSNQVVFLLHRGSIRWRPAGGPPGTGWEELHPPQRSVGGLCVADAEGTIWYRTSDKQLVRWRGQGFESLSEAEGLGTSLITCLAVSAQGEVWVGTEQGILAWDGSRFQDMTPTNAAASAEVKCLSVARDGSYWALADGRWRRAANRHWFQEAEDLRGVFAGNTTRLAARSDHNGGLWVSDYGLGLMHIGADGLVHRLGPQDGFPGDRVGCFLEDREGNWWAGVDAGGLVRIRERRFQTIDVGNETSLKPAKSVCEDIEGTMWIATLGDGLLYGRAGLFTPVIMPGGTEKGFAFCAAADPSGRLWVSAGDEDLYVRETDTFQRVTPTVHGVKALLVDRAGQVWAGTKSGLTRSTPDAPFVFRSVSGIARESIRALAEDPQGSIWAGADDGRLYRISEAGTMSYQPDDTELPHAIWSLLTDEDGTVWVGTFRGGLLRFRDGQFTRYGKEDGLPDNVISQMLPDAVGNLWFGSQIGIFKVPRAAFEDYVPGESVSLPVMTFGRSDGLPSLQCSSGYQPAACRGADGRLWFTTVKGAVSVSPGTVRPNPLPPPVVIEEILIDKKRLNVVMPHPDEVPPQVKRFDAARGYLEIEPGRHQLEIHYTGLSLVASDRVRFRYQLAGTDLGWFDAGMQRYAQFNFLPPGHYRFQVTACNSDGVWNETGQSLTLVILPHVYETWWFQALVAALAAVLVAGAARYVATRRLHQKMEQLARQQAVERERTRIAKDIHDDLGANLTLIAVLGDLAKREKAEERIEKMASTARQSVKSLDEIVWAVNPRNDTLAHLIDYTGQFAVDYLRAAGLRCLLDFPEHAPLREVPTSMRHNLFLAVKEALQNVVKHAHATAVWLRIRITSQQLRIEVEDNGHGFESAPDDALADGLRNMRQRMEEIGGTCTVKSQPGKGTEITLELPWTES